MSADLPAELREAAGRAVVATCPAHPGAIFDACGPCLREAHERAEKAKAERDAARRELAAVGAERDWMLMAAEGEPVSDFAESFPAVARVAALAAHHAALDALLAQARRMGAQACADAEPAAVQMALDAMIHDGASLAEGLRQWAAVVASLNEPAWADGQHAGDCTGAAMTCNRCVVENYRREVGDLLERAAEAAHDAWMAAKVAQGFHAPEACPGSTDDAGHVDVSGRLLACRRCHQDIRSYADLDEPTKELDRAHVRAVHGVYAEQLAALEAERDAARREAAEARAALVAAEADLDERRKELAAERGKRRLFKERVRRAANAACTCGGGGSDCCCPACRVWHNLGGERMDTAEGTPHRNL